jgi:hypothetical protein
MRAARHARSALAEAEAIRPVDPATPASETDEDRFPAIQSKQKKNKSEFRFLFNWMTSLARTEQKEYIFTGGTGPSGLH